MKKFLLLALAVCAVLPAYAQDKKNNYSIAYETSSYGYKEPLGLHHMELKGRMSGVVFDYIGRSAFTTKEVDANDPSFLALQLRYMQGDTNYDGWLVYTPGPTYVQHYCPDIPNYYLEGRLTAGGVYEVGSAVEFWPYLGIAGRYLVNKLNEDPANTGYRRTSTYIYAPVGATAKIKLPSEWAISLNGEYDIFINGKQQSRLSDINPAFPDLNHTQTRGYGVRTSAKLSKDFKHIGVFAEPFFRYWHIRKSNIDTYGYLEPDNETHESGLKIGVTF